MSVEPQNVQRWEYLALPFKDAEVLKKDRSELTPARLNGLGSQGWEAVGLPLKRGDLIAPEPDGSAQRRSTDRPTGGPGTRPCAGFVP